MVSSEKCIHRDQASGQRTVAYLTNKSALGTFRLMKWVWAATGATLPFRHFGQQRSGQYMNDANVECVLCLQTCSGYRAPEKQLCSKDKPQSFFKTANTGNVRRLGNIFDVNVPWRQKGRFIRNYQHCWNRGDCGNSDQTGLIGEDNPGRLFHVCTYRMSFCDCSGSPKCNSQKDNINTAAQLGHREKCFYWNRFEAPYHCRPSMSITSTTAHYCFACNWPSAKFCFLALIAASTFSVFLTTPGVYSYP